MAAGADDRAVDAIGQSIVRRDRASPAATSSMNVHWTWSSLNWLARPCQRPPATATDEALVAPRCHGGTAPRAMASRHPAPRARPRRSPRRDRGRRAPRSLRATSRAACAARHPVDPAAIADRGDRVSEVVLAVAERALAVLPRLAPVNRRQRHEHDVRRPAQTARHAVAHRTRSAARARGGRPRSDRRPATARGRAQDRTRRTPRWDGGCRSTG